jgi:hypothetical protein
MARLFMDVTLGVQRTANGPSVFFLPKKSFVLAADLNKGK